MPRNITHRLFFAAWPDAAARAELRDLVESLRGRYAARWVRPSRWHLTLAFLGTSDHVPQELVERASAAGGTVRSPAFAWRPDTVRGFHGARPPCVLTSGDSFAPLQELHTALVEALADAGIVLPDQRAWVPHVTLGYSRAHIVHTTPVPALDFPVREFVLLHSISGEADYRELGRWPLSADA